MRRQGELPTGPFRWVVAGCQARSASRTYGSQEVAWIAKSLYPAEAYLCRLSTVLTALNNAFAAASTEYDLILCLATWPMAAKRSQSAYWTIILAMPAISPVS